MNTENIKTIFLDYLNVDKSQHAILLNGTWGSGKTYFWKYTLQEIAEKEEFKILYISLNGISKIDALEHLLFIKLLPFIGKKENGITKNATAFVTNIINQVSKYYLKSSLSDIFKGVSVDSFNFKKYVICFDDLERCQIPVKEVLGFINNYVEHKNLKTIILADETNIDINGKSYDNIKEKVIGRVLNFELDVEETIPHLFVKFKAQNNDFYNFLMTEKKNIIDILVEYKQENLRIISFFLDILEKLFPSFKNADEKYVQELLLFATLITIEFKQGNLKSTDYKNPKGLDVIDEGYEFLLMSNLLGKPEEDVTKKRPKEYSEIFYEKYLKKRIKNYYFYPSVYSYILSGYLNITDLGIEIKNRTPEITPQETLDFRQLLNYNFRGLTNEEFRNLTVNVLKYAYEGFYSIYDYIQIAKFYYYFSTNKIIPETSEEIKKIIYHGLEIAKAKKQINNSVFDNIFHFQEDNPEVIIIRDVVREIHHDIKKEHSIKESNKLLDCIVSDDESALREIFREHMVIKPLFEFIDNKRLFNTLIKSTNKQIFNFTNLLLERYESSNIGEFLYGDIECLRMLHNELEAYVTTINESLQPRFFLISSLIDSLKSICIHLEKTRKK